MKRKLILLNLVLAGLTATAAWKLREQYLADQRLNAVVRKNPVKPVPTPPVAATPKPDPFTGVTYADVAQKNLFAKDRNPNVIVDVVAPPPPKKMPPLPVLYGVMGLPSGMTALLAERPDARTQGVHVGDVIGDFKVMAINTQTIAFEWDGKRIDKKVEELVDHSPPPQEAAGVNQAAVPTGPPPPAKPSAIAMGENTKGCQPGDTSPPGTIADGYRKISEPTPFGPACRWVKIN